jgi:hypothetical protein
MPLQEFSKIVILRDTPESRFLFGPPINENSIKTANIFERNSTNPFYTRLSLVGANYMIQGWRNLYPDFDIAINPDVSGATYSEFETTLRNNFRSSILQTMTNEEESPINGYNKLPKSAGTAIIVGNKLYVGGSTAGWTYDTETTFNIPTPALGVGDFIFWGDDPNSLKIGGKIKTVYTSGTNFNAGARYEFEQATKEATGTVGDPVNIYYYRKGWNGKGIKNLEQKDPNEIGGGFYVLIKLEGPRNNRSFPYLGFDEAQRGAVAGAGVPNSPEHRIIGNDLYAFTDLIRIRRISNKWKSDETEDDTIGEDIIPCTIHRTNNFYFDYNNGLDTPDWVNGKLVSVHRGIANYGGFPTSWCAYYVNPYGGSDFRLDKNTTYVLEVNERLPAANVGDGQFLFNFAVSSAI